MRQITAGLSISLDGVIENPHEWHFPYFNEEMGAAVSAQLGAADTMLLSVEEPLPHYASAAEQVLADETLVAAYFEELLASARKEAATAGITLETETVRGHASRAIVHYAQEIGADLIIVGQHGHAGILDQMLGSTSDRVVDTATCAVLVVPADLHRH